MNVPDAWCFEIALGDAPWLVVPELRLFDGPMVRKKNHQKKHPWIARNKTPSTDDS